MVCTRQEMKDPCFPVLIRDRQRFSGILKVRLCHRSAVLTVKPVLDGQLAHRLNGAPRGITAFQRNPGQLRDAKEVLPRIQWPPRRFGTARAFPDRQLDVIHQAVVLINTYAALAEYLPVASSQTYSLSAGDRARRGRVSVIEEIPTRQGRPLASLLLHARFAPANET